MVWLCNNVVMWFSKKKKIVERATHCHFNFFIESFLFYFTLSMIFLLSFVSAIDRKRKVMVKCLYLKTIWYDMIWNGSRIERNCLRLRDSHFWYLCSFCWCFCSCLNPNLNLNLNLFHCFSFPHISIQDKKGERFIHRNSYHAHSTL